MNNKKIDPAIKIGVDPKKPSLIALKYRFAVIFCAIGAIASPILSIKRSIISS